MKTAINITPAQHAALKLLRTICLPTLVFLVAGGGGPAQGAAEPEIESETAPTAKTTAERTRQRLDWNRKTLAGAYDQVGRKDAKWDEAARQALEAMAKYRTARDENAGAEQKKVSDFSHQATQAGCKDPLLVYLHLRYHAPSGTTADKLAAQYREAADGLLLSEYPPVRKFYASVRAAEQTKTAQASKTTTPPEAVFYRRAALTNLLAMLDDPSTPIGEATDASLDLLKAVETNAKQYEEFYVAMQKLLFKNWPKEGGPYLVKGAFYVKHAWNARGGGYANSVTEAGWRLFEERLKIAAQALERAWQLDSTDKRICYHSMTVELGMGDERADMEKWFERGMKLDASYYDLCRHKLYYLEPKWHGEPEDLVKFGRQCVKSESWGGRVPLILVDAYETLSRYVDRGKLDEFWKEPEVWPDIRSSYEKYFKLNPTMNATRNNYALHAYRCGQWDAFLKQIELVGQAVNYSLFGGQAQFEHMRQNAKEQAAAKEKKKYD